MTDAPAPHPLLVCLGARVRALRGEREWTLAELAARARLSPRFLQDLEAGRGNISVARLAAVADALGVPVAHLLDQPDAGAARERALLALEARALAEDEVRQVLAFARARRRAGGKAAGEKIALVGLRGAGKTTIGARVAQRLGVPFVELDQEIERAAGMPLSDVFSIHGERFYRRLEREALDDVLKRKGPLVIATGGGIVMEASTWDLLCGSCHTVWLEASPDDHWNRVVAQGDQRPMRDHPQAMAQLRSLLRARSPLYARARDRVNTSALGLDGAVEAVLSRVEPPVPPRRLTAANTNKSSTQ